MRKAQSLRTASCIKLPHFTEDDEPEKHDTARVPIFLGMVSYHRVFLGSSLVKSSPSNAGHSRNTGSIPRWGRSPGEGNSNPLQYSCPENSMGRGAWWATVCGVAKSRTQLSTCTFTHAYTHTLWGFNSQQ